MTMKLIKKEKKLFKKYINKNKKNKNKKRNLTADLE